MGERFFAFEKLDIYHEAVDIAADVYRLTHDFPADERFGLTNQLRRAATSITLNIAEGSGRETGKDFAHFLILSRGSVYEVVAALQLSVQLGYLQAESLPAITNKVHILCAKITALARKKREQL